MDRDVARVQERAAGVHALRDADEFEDGEGDHGAGAPIPEEFFHRRGIRGVGVETIAEAAGANKMTLCRHFGSKDDLILEYPNDKGRKADEVWAGIEAASPGDPVGQLYGYVGQRVIEEFKIRQRQRLEALCEAAGATEPGLLADALVLLIEGARVSRRSVGSEGPSANLVGSGKAVIAAFGVRPQRPTSSTY